MLGFLHVCVGTLLGPKHKKGKADLEIGSESDDKTDHPNCAGLNAQSTRHPPDMGASITLHPDTNLQKVPSSDQIKSAVDRDPQDLRAHGDGVYHQHVIGPPKWHSLSKIHLHMVHRF